MKLPPIRPTCPLAGLRRHRLLLRIGHGDLRHRPRTTALPIEIFSYLQFQGSQLAIAAASTLQVAMIVLLVAGIERVVGIGWIVRSR